jgi:hypothetical protein
MTTPQSTITSQGILQSAGVNHLCMRCQSWPHAAHFESNIVTKWSAEARLFVHDGGRIQVDRAGLWPIARLLHEYAEKLGFQCLLHSAAEELAPRPGARESAPTSGTSDSWQNSAYDFAKKVRTCYNERTARPQALVTEHIQALTVPRGMSSFGVTIPEADRKVIMELLVMFHSCPTRWKLLRSNTGKWPEMITFVSKELSDLKRNTEPGMKPRKVPGPKPKGKKGKKRGAPETPVPLPAQPDGGPGSEVERVRRIVSQTWAGSRYMYERATFGKANSEILREARPLIEAAAKTATWRAASDASQICGCELRMHSVAGVAHVQRAQHSSTGKLHTVCSICGQFGLFREYRYVSELGYVCSKHPELTAMPMPVDGILRAFPPRPESLLADPDSLLRNHPHAPYEKLTHSSFMGHVNRKLEHQWVTRPVHLAALDPRWCDANVPYAERGLDMEGDRVTQEEGLLRYVQRHACRECVRSWAMAYADALQQAGLETQAMAFVDLACSSEPRRVQPPGRRREEFGYAKALMRTIQAASQLPGSFENASNDIGLCKTLAQCAAYAHAMALLHDEVQAVRMPNGVHVFCLAHYQDFRRAAQDGPVRV